MNRTHIKANQPWWRIDWREIAGYRDLLWFLIRRDIVAVYAQSVLGPLWYVIQPLAITLVFTVIFGNIAGIGTDGINPFLFYMSGIVLWTFFQGCLMDVSATFVSNTHLFGKVYFPRLIVPLGLAAKNAVQLALNLAIFLGFHVYFLLRAPGNLQPNAWLLAVPLLILQAGLAGIGAGLWLTSLTAKYRDLRYALTFLAQLWMFATPIAWSATGLSDRWRWLLLANPMASVVTFNRHAFLGTGTTDISLLITGFVASLVLFISGLLVFNRVQRTFIDIV